MAIAAFALGACGTTLHDPIEVAGTTGPGAVTPGAGTVVDPATGATVPLASGGTAGGGATVDAAGATPGAAGPGGDPTAGPAVGAAPAAVTDPISIGFVVTETGNAGALGISTGQTFSQRQAVEAVVGAMNAQGGLAGRQIQPVIDATDTASVSWESDYASACAALTQDNHVEAVLGYTFAFVPSFESCLSNAGVVHLTNAYNIADHATFAQFPYLFSLTNPTLDRVYATLLTGSAQYGRVTPQSRIGLVMTECAFDTRAWEGSGAPTAARLGLNVVEIARISCPTGSATVGTVITQLQNAVLRFRSAGVDTVIVEGPPIIIFAGAAESQGWRPRYLASTLTGGAALPENLPAEQAANVTGIGWFSAIDVAGSRQPARTPPQQRCIDLLQAGGLSPSGYNDLVTAYTTCDALFLYEASLRATNGNSDAAAVAAAVEAIGGSYQSASALDGVVRFGPGQHEGTAVARPWAWDGSCGCFAYTSDPGFSMP